MRPTATWPQEYIVLGLLCEQPTYGYELYGRIESDPTWQALWRVDRSRLYFLLHKLVHAGLITALAEEGAGGPPRLLYAPTLTGRATLAEWLRTPDSPPHQLRTAFLAKLYLAVRVEPTLVAELLAGQRAALAEWVERQEARAQGTSYAAWVARLRLAQIEVARAWLDEITAAWMDGRLAGIGDIDSMDANAANGQQKEEQP